MAWKQIGVTTGGNKKEFAVPSTDLQSTWPTATDCGAGSEMTIYNPATHAITGFRWFDGVDWNTY